MDISWSKMPWGEMRGATRAALQAAAAATVTYLVMRWVGLNEYFIAILSAVYILTPTIDGTVQSGMLRVTATLIGSVIGIACLFILPDTWGTIAAIALSMLVLGALAHLRPVWSYGMVAAAALSLRADENAVQVAIDRGLAIGLGALIGTLATFVVWPERADTRFRYRLAAAQGAIARHAEAALDRARGEDREEKVRKADQAYHEQIGHARSTAEVVRLDRDRRRDDRLRATDRLYHSLTLIDRAVEHAGSDPLSGKDDFHGLVENVREHAVGLLNTLRGDAGGDAQQMFDQLNDDTQSARQILQDDDPDDDGHLRRAVLVYGMMELREALGNLFDELNTDDRRSLAGATLREAGLGRMAPD